jgi:hypothetical protein
MTPVKQRQSTFGMLYVVADIETLNGNTLFLSHRFSFLIRNLLPIPYLGKRWLLVSKDESRILFTEIQGHGRCAF